MRVENVLVEQKFFYVGGSRRGAGSSRSCRGRTVGSVAGNSGAPGGAGPPAGTAGSRQCCGRRPGRSSPSQHGQTSTTALRSLPLTMNNLKFPPGIMWNPFQPSQFGAAAEVVFKDCLSADLVVPYPIARAAICFVPFQAAQLAAAAERTAALEALLHCSTAAALAGAVVALGSLPGKLNVVIQPLVGAVRREPEALLRDRAGGSLAKLLWLCVGRTPCPNDKCAPLRLTVGSHTFFTILQYAAPNCSLFHFMANFFILD